MNKPHCITCGGNHDGDFCPPAADPVLLPCPFCGSDAGYCTSTHDHGIDHIAVCNECPARIETGKKERTIEAWNRRSGFPPHPVLKDDTMRKPIGTILVFHDSIEVKRLDMDTNGFTETRYPEPTAEKLNDAARVLGCWLELAGPQLPPVFKDDPGEDWELVPVKTVIDERDEYSPDKGRSWYLTTCAGKEVQPNDTYRRRKPPADVWPKYYVCDTWCSHAYITRDSDGKLTPYFNDGRRDSHTRDWDEMDDMNVVRQSFREVPESEALARVKPAEPIAAEHTPDHRPAREVIMNIEELLHPTNGEKPAVYVATRVAQQWLEDNPEDPSPFAKPFTDARSGMGIRKEHPVGRTATPLVNAVAESPDDWVEITDPEHCIRVGLDWFCICGDDWEQQKHYHCDGPIGHWLADGQRVRCRRRDLPAPPATKHDDPERWFMWFDDRYPIAFVKRAGGKVFNLNVDGLFKTSDDWGPGYEEKLTNGELIEVTERSARAYLARPRRKIVDTPAQQPKRTPVRLWCLKNSFQNVGSGVIACTEMPDDQSEMWSEIKGTTFYLEGE